MPWITEEKRRKCTVCGKLRNTWYQSPSADKPQPECRQCHEERDRARREARMAARVAEPKPEPRVIDIADNEPITAAEGEAVAEAKAKPKRSRKTGEASGTAKAIAANREVSTASA